MMARRIRTSRLVGGALLTGSVIAVVAAAQPAGERVAVEPTVTAERMVHWEHFHEVVGERAPGAVHAEVVLTPETFDGARRDLADVRLFDALDREVPYALQERSPRDSSDLVAAEPFNRTRGPDASSQLSLDLDESRFDHNELEIELEGQNFRRRVRIEGSDDAVTWSRLVEQDVLRFELERERLVAQTVRYGPSRHRYLRLTIWPDPQVDLQPVEIGSVVARRRIEVPRELVRHDVAFDARQPVRASGGPGSSWTLDLGGRDVPCSRLYLEMSDLELARDWTLEAAGPAEGGEPFRRIASGTWRRRAGEPIEPMVATFDEVRAARMRLVVTDHRNPPLHIHRISAEAAARVVVFPAQELPAGPVRLYHGNPRAEAPRYDFARNLPPTLEPLPHRLELGPRELNPLFQPEPLPLTERWPGLIYLLLGLAVTVLGALIVNLIRASIAIADRRKDQV